MDREKRGFIFLAIFLIAASGFFLFTKEPAPHYIRPDSVDISSIPDSEREEENEEDLSENPIKRLEFELGQLIDPATGKIPENIKQKELAYARKRLLPESRQTSRYALNPYAINNEQGVAQTQESFVNMGPFNIGGRTRALAIDVANENIILAGGVSGGVWKSTDQGASWSRVSGLQDHPSVTSIVQDKRAGKTNDWYYATGEFTGNSASDRGAFYQGNGLYKSSNNGDSWQLISSTAQPGTSGTDVITSAKRFTITDQLAIDNSEPSGTEIYAGGLSKLYRSTDGFQTFTTVLGANNGGNNFVDVAITSTGKVFATIANSSFNGNSAEDGLFMSNDGITWQNIEPTTNFPSSFDRIEIAIDPSDESKVYFAGSNRLFLFDDTDDSWTDLSSNLGVSTSDVGEGHSTQGGYDLFAAVHPANPDVVFIGGVNLLRSTDGYRTSGNRKQVGGYNNDNNPNNFPRYPNHHPDNHAYAFFPSNPDKMLSATDGGIHLTQNNQANVTNTNPVTWSSLNNGYTTTQFYHASIHLHDLGDFQILGGMQDNGTWGKLAESPQVDWDEFSGGDGAYSAVAYNSVLTSSQNGNLRRFVLNGSTYALVQNITPSSSDSDFLFVNPYVVNPVNQDQVFVGARSKVFFTNDVRTNPTSGAWNQITSSQMTGQQVSAMAMSIDPEGVLYYGTRTGEIFKVENTVNLENNATPTRVTGVGMPTNANVSGIAVDPKDSEKLMVTFSNYGVVSVWYSENGGSTWASISGNLEENSNGSGAGPSIRSAAIMPDGNGGNYYFVGTSVGLYMTQNLNADNTVWTQQAANSIGNVVVTSLMVRPVEGMLLAATHGNGVFTGFYDVGINPTVNYSVNVSDNSYLLRGNRSFDANQGMAYQWFKDGAPIDGETSNELEVTDGGNYQLRLQINGKSGTGMSNTIAVNLDGQGPTITSIERFNPSTQNTDLTSVTFQVTFDEDVVGVSTDDFEVTGAATGVVSNVAIVPGGSSVFNIQVTNIGGQGTLGLAVSATNNITDNVGNEFTGSINSSETYTISDITAPSVAITRQTPATQITDQNRVTFLVTFSENVDNVEATDFTLANDLANAEISDVTAVTQTKSYAVTVSQIIEDGTVDLDFASSQNIADGAGNAFTGTITTEETYTIQNVIAGIEDIPNRSIKEIWVDTNPTSGEFTLILPDVFIGQIEYNIINSSGLSVKTGSIDNYQPLTEIKVDLTNHADGLYIYEAASANGRTTVKLLKRSR